MEVTEAVVGRLSDYAEEPASVMEFCDRHKLRDHLGTALRLASECFLPDGRPAVKLRQDPENGEEWLLVQLTARRGIEEALAAYDCYVSRWVESVPWPERNLVRLSYTLAER